MAQKYTKFLTLLKHSKVRRLTAPIDAYKRLYFAIILAVLSGINCANAIGLLCSAPEELSKLSKDEFSVALVKDSHISLGDLPQLFSASYKNNRNEAIRICVYPVDNPSTRILLESLGVNRRSFQSLLAQREAGKDKDFREIKLVSSESEMFQCVEGSYPSVGYVANTTNMQHDLGCY